MPPKSCPSVRLEECRAEQRRAGQEEGSTGCSWDRAMELVSPDLAVLCVVTCSLSGFQLNVENSRGATYRVGVHCLGGLGACLPPPRFFFGILEVISGAFSDHIAITFWGATYM